MKYIGAAALLLLCLFTAENSGILRVRREVFRKSGIKIAHIADLHKRRFGKDNCLLCDRTEREQPDIIMISGDIVSRDCKDLAGVRSLFERLVRMAPVYMVFGNHEADLAEKVQRELINTAEETGVHLLRNQSEEIAVKGRKLNICGLELKYSVYKKNGRYRDLDTVDTGEIKSLVGSAPKDTETVLLVHNPLFAQSYSQWGADYAVAGHVHGGSVRIPFLNIGVLSPERKFFPKYTKGVYDIGDMKLLLSGGLGKLRLFNPPELVIYEI